MRLSLSQRSLRLGLRFSAQRESVREKVLEIEIIEGLCERACYAPKKKLTKIKIEGSVC